MNNIIIFITIFLVIFAIIIFYRKNKVKEHYQTDLFNTIKQGKDNNSWDQLSTVPRHPNCYELKPGQCLKYPNCGLCTDGDHLGSVECVPGDEHGPLFKTGCNRWIYRNFYDRQNFNESTIRSTPSFDRFEKIYDVMYPSPVSRSALF